MAETPDNDQKTEDPTPKRRKDAAEKGDVLQSRELGTALVIWAGAAWIVLAGPWIMEALGEMLAASLRFDHGDVRNFDPWSRFVELIAIVLLPLGALMGIAFLATIVAPALLGSLGFRASAFGFKGEKLNPISGIKRIFGINGLIELIKSLAKVILLGWAGWWLITSYAGQMVALGSQDVRAAIGDLGGTFIIAVVVMAGMLALIALVDVPAQVFQRMQRLRMTKQEVKDEHKQTEGSPELKAAIRRKQHEVLRGSARKAVAEATVVLTNPTHFAVALRYRPGYDAAPVVVARGRGATAAAIRELAGESKIPVLSYPQLTRAIYYTVQTGHTVREDLYIAVATVLAFVFNLDAAMAQGIVQPDVDVPENARFDENGRAQT
ncbi:EscU/YscU/HrcU family type III secretion system export apparatus switch protein [Sphingomonas cavernae]|uniref:Flagellar biosynthesis protein FlhB n=1 Tax=Sphingomonas cavernae TaxID=2320861 RepID=A0A418WPR2_9SPHN|nr:flagellar type III secretion system protein FlhB [Sphingomonas cavernae]RJF93216.1 flagellar biosynthesis protein FlhB [Sphingomonas cavernae]